MGTLLETNIGVGGVGGGVGLPGGTKVELAFDLQEPAFQSDHFRMYDFKVKRCPRARPHDWTACPFAHPGEKAKRRDPRRYRYSGTACPDFRKTGVCRRGDACPYSHGVFECWLHPSRYRTQMCTDGPSCRRRVCFFAHFEHELRRAEEYPPLLNTQLHASLVADARSLQQQQLAQALSGILGSPAPALGGGGGGPAALESLMNVQLLKTLSQQTSGGLMPAESAPATPTGLSGLSPSSTLGGVGGVAAPPLTSDSAHLLLQLQLMQQQQAGGALRTTLSDASQQSGSSPGGSPRLVGGGGSGDAFAGGDAARQGLSPAFQSDEASQLARLLQHQHQHHQHPQVAAGAIDPALLVALRNLGLGAGGGVPEGLDLASARRSIDNGALSRPSGPDNYLAAAAAALASGTALGGLGAVPAQPPASSPATLLNTTTGGSLPSQSFMAAAAAALQGGGGPPAAAHGVPDAGEPSLSLDHILAELPRSASQVKLPTQ